MGASGINYVAAGSAERVCEPGDFVFGFSGLDHGHCYGMTTALKQAGGVVAWVHDPDPAKVAAYREKFPEARPCSDLADMLRDPTVAMVACAAVPSSRVETGLLAQAAGKHFFSDKPGFIRREDVARARDSVRKTGLLWSIYYSERLHNEASVRVDQLVAAGAIGKVVSVTGFGPHRLAAPTRPEWFWDPAKAGGIIADLASHQIEQFLHYAGVDDAKVEYAKVGNFTMPGRMGFSDYGELCLSGPGGESGYFRVDWLTPDGLGIWGDGRITLVGTKGYIEARKYIDVARDPEGDHVYVVDGGSERYEKVSGKMGFPFFGQLIRDCLDGTRLSLGQERAFRVAELAIEAQELAERGR